MYCALETIMPQDIFKLLNINPTNDFVFVKKTYLQQALKIHPDKNPNISKEKFQELANAFDLVKTPELLKKYNEDLRSNRTPQAAASRSAPPDDTTDIYLTIPIVEKKNKNEENEESAVFRLPKLKSNSKEVFSRDFPYNELSNCVNNYHKYMDIQIGESVDEALKIMGQHGKSKMLIVQVRVPITSLSLLKFSEAELANSNILNAKGETPFFLFKKEAPTIKAQNIMLARPVLDSEYPHTRTRGQAFNAVDIDRIWPKGHEQVQIDTIPTLTAGTQTENTLKQLNASQEYKTKLAAIMPAKANNPSNFIEGINRLIQELSDEKTNFPRGDQTRALKNQQALALCQLKNQASLGEDDVDVLIAKITKEFPECLQDKRLTKLFSDAINEYHDSQTRPTM